MRRVGILIDWIRVAARVDMRPDFAEKGRLTMLLKRIRGSRMACAGGQRIRFASSLPLLFLAMIGFSAMGTTETRADFRVCNATQNLVGVGIGYRAKAGWVTEGWWHIEGSSCKTLIEGPLSSRFYYLYAEDAERGGRWDGPINMCVAEKEFKIAGVNDCFARGFQRAGFQEYDTGEQASWMVQLTDEPATDGDEAVTGQTTP
jgi:uncharacterized membrane protein